MKVNLPCVCTRVCAYTPLKYFSEQMLKVLIIEKLGMGGPLEQWVYFQLLFNAFLISEGIAF